MNTLYDQNEYLTDEQLKALASDIVQAVEGNLDNIFPPSNAIDQVTRDQIQAYMPTMARVFVENWELTVRTALDELKQSIDALPEEQSAECQKRFTDVNNLYTMLVAGYRVYMKAVNR